MPRHNRKRTRNRRLAAVSGSVSASGFAFGPGSESGFRCARPPDAMPKANPQTNMISNAHVDDRYESDPTRRLDHIHHSPYDYDNLYDNHDDDNNNEDDEWALSQDCKPATVTFSSSSSAMTIAALRNTYVSSDSACVHHLFEIREGLDEEAERVIERVFGLRVDAEDDLLCERMLGVVHGLFGDMW